MHVFPYCILVVQKERNLLGRITTLVLCRQSPLNLHQFCLTRDSKYGLVGTDWNAICRYFALIQLYLVYYVNVVLFSYFRFTDPNHFKLLKGSEKP